MYKRFLHYQLEIQLTPILLLALFFSLLPLTNCFSQFDSTSIEIAQDSTRLPSEQLEVIKNYVPELAKANRITVKPRIVEQNAKPPSYQYDITIVPLEIVYPNPSIRPLAMIPELPSDYYDKWIKLGYNTLSSPYINGGLSYDHNGIFTIDASYLYDGAEDEVPILRKYTRNELKLNGDYQREHINLYGSIEVDLLSRFLYGFDSSSPTGREDYKRVVNNFAWHLGIRNNIINDSNVHYDIRPYLSLTTVQGGFIDSSNVREVNTGIDIRSVKQLGEKSAFKLDLDIKISAANRDSLPSNFTTIFNPSFSRHGEKFRLEAGLHYVYGSGNHYPWPFVDLQYAILEDQLFLLLGSSQNQRINNYKNLSFQNHYIRNKLEELSNQLERNIHLGLQGNIGRQIAYKAQMGYQITDNMPLFLNGSAANINQFDIQFENLEAIFLKASVKDRLSDWLEIGADLHYRYFIKDTIEEVWHIPSTIANIHATVIDQNEKYHIKTLLNYASRATFLNEGLIQSTNQQFELNIDGTYKFREHISVFLQLNNLLNNQYQRWYLYRDFGFNAMGGLSLRF